MKRTSLMRYAVAIAVISVALAGMSSSFVFAAAQSKSEMIEWTWEVRPQHADSSLPNVLLVGDSISRNYFPQVTQDLREWPMYTSWPVLSP